MDRRYCCIVILVQVIISSVRANGPVYIGPSETTVKVESTAVPNDKLITQTVYGFLDFTTTIANTIMVFSPQSQPDEAIKPTPVTIKSTPNTAQLSSKVEVKTAPAIVSSKIQVREETVTVSKPTITPSKSIKVKTEVSKKVQSSVKQNIVKAQPKNLEINVISDSKQVFNTPKNDAKSKIKNTSSSIISSNVNIKLSTSEEPVLFENHLEQAEYDFLSRQPSEIVDETYKVVDIVPTAKPRNGVTGLVTKLGGTIVKEGVTTVHETSVIGTYISGKYAQILKSSSHIVNKVTPTLHKTFAHNHKTKTPLEPSVLEDSLPLEALFTTPPSQNLVRQTRRPAVSPPFKNRLQRTKIQETTEKSKAHEIVENSKKQTARPFKISHNRFGRPSTSSSEIATVSVFSETLSPTRRYHRHRSANVASTVTSNSIETGSRRFKPKPSPVSNDASTTLYKFKLTRPQGRWQYKTSPKPRVAIRRQDEDNILPTPILPELENSEVQTEIPDIQSITGATPTLPIETIKVDISTPADFSNVYYEIATIKSPYTFQVGTLKNTRYITVTSTQEKYLIEPTEVSATEPLTENILTTKPAYDRDASIATLPAIAIAGEESLPLETMTETFSTSEFLLKTHLLPVVRDSNTTTLTLVQTYEVTKLVTATKTLPPTELFQFIPSKTLNEFNTRLDEAGSELHLELEFGDNNNNDDEPPSARTLPEFNNNTNENQILQQQTTTSSTPPFVQEQLSPEQLQQLAFLRLLNPNQPPVLTSTPVISVQTLYETHVIPVFNGFSTLLSTISRPVGTVTNTQYMTNTVQLPSLPLPFFPTPQLQLTPQITSTPIVTQTIVTETNSKILKLTFGAKTAYTTLYSTKVVPTLLTTFLTAQLPISPTSQFPSYFPPFNPFQFVG